MSLNGITQPFFPLTIDGTTSLSTDAIYIDGQLFTPSNYVPYTGANKTIDAGSQNIKTTHYATANSDLVNVQVLNDAVAGVYPIVGANFLNKLITTPQTVAGPVSYTTLSSTTLSSTNFSTTTADLGGGVFQTGANYRRSETDASITANSLFGSITSSMGVYQATSTGNFAVLGVATSLTPGKQYKINLNMLVNLPLYNANVQLYASSDGTSLTEPLGPSVSFPPSSTIFKLLTGTFTPSYPYLVLLCLNTEPSGIATYEWFGLELYEAGNSLQNATFPQLTASTIPVLNQFKQLVSSGVSSSKIAYLDNVSSDIQTQLNSKLNLTGGTMSGNITMGSFKVTSNATPSIGDDYINKTYGDSTYATSSALGNYLPLTGGTLTGPLTISSGALTANTRLLGVPDAPSGGNFWIGLAGSDSETNRLAISLIGDQVYGTCSGVYISKPLNMGTNKITTTYSATNAEDVVNVSTLQTALGNYVPRTGDAALSGNYVTSGYWTGSAMISNSFYGPQFSQLYQKANDPDKWFKIIQLGNGGPSSNGTLMASGEFLITYSVAGNHGFIYFSVGVSYNATPYIKIEKSIIYGSTLITELRLALNDASIYYNGYVEMKTAPAVNWYSNNVTIRVYQINQAPLDAPSYITVLQSKTPGSTSGYTYYNVLADTAFDINRDNRRFYLAGTQAYMGGVRFDVAGGLRGLGNGAGGGGGDIWMENISSDSNAYAVMYLRTNAGGCYWFMNSSNRTADGGANTATLRNDNGSLRLQGQGASGTFQVWSNGVCNVHDGSGAYGYQFSQPGALVVGSITRNFSGWASTILLECLDNAEIAVHDSGMRLTSLAYYEGANNRIYIGRDMGNGWGTASVEFPNRITVGGTMSDGKINVRNPNGSYTHLGWTDNCNYFRGVVTYMDTMLTCNSTVNFSSSQPVNFGSWALGSPDANLNPYGNVSTWGAGKNNWTGYSIKQNYALMNYAFSDEVGFHSRIHTWLWYSTGATRDIVLAGSGRFSQDWDRLLVYCNGVNTAGGYFYYNSGNAYGTISDRRIKKDFQRITTEQSIAFIKILEPTSFCLKEQKPCCVKNVDGVEEEVTPAVCSCRQDGWTAQNVLEAAEKSGASKSVVNNWYDYQQELGKPEEERKTLIGVSDRPILSHTVNVVKALMEQVETLQKRNLLLEQHANATSEAMNALNDSFAEYRRQTDERFNKLVQLLLQK